MAWTFATLKAADAALPGAPLGLQAAADALNAQTTNAAADMSWSSIRDVLMNNFDWGTLVQTAEASIGAVLPGASLQTAAIQSAAKAIRECCLYGGTFKSSNTTVWNRLTAAASLLTPAGVGAITSASSTAVVALRTPAVKVWQPEVTTGDIQTARGQP